MCVRVCVVRGGCLLLPQGAGDAFVGAMAYFLACHPNLPFPEVMRRSGVIASYTTTSPGTQSSYLVEQLPADLLAS